MICNWELKLKKYQGRISKLFSEIPEKELKDIYTRALAISKHVKRGMEEKFPDAKYYRQEVNPEVINIGDYNQAGQRIYAANVTLMRAVPNILDGLKPVERRSLISLPVTSLTPSGRTNSVRLSQFIHMVISPFKIP